MKITKYILPLSILLVATTAAADQDHICTSGNETRTISVEYEHKGWSVPCRVKYEKPAQNLVEYPWNAQATVGYCEEKAAFLAGKLENWGWTCTRAGEETSEE